MMRASKGVPVPDGECGLIRIDKDHVICKTRLTKRQLRAIRQARMSL
ncbi:MAG: hypothetical protein H0T79_17110 [Deltaproteobacteria bacterium]|nr:hypothetical protein [Deltaproteobacteria bacterium]